MRSFFNRRSKALSPTVIRLGLVSFFADVSSEMLYPITPIFLTTVLGASMLSVGLIEGFAESLASLLKTYAGSYSDRSRKRRPFITGGYFLAAIAKPMIGIATGWPLVLAARGLDRTGKGLRSAPRDALLSDSIPANLQGEAFGWHRLMDTMGAAIGPLFAIVFLSLPARDMRSLYFWALVPGLIATAITLSVKETPGRALAEPKKTVNWKWGDMSAPFKTYLFGWGLFTIANSSDVFLILKAKSSGAALSTTILMYCFYNLIYAILSPYLGHLSDRMKRKNVLIFGLSIFAFVYLGFTVATRIWEFWVLFGVYGVYMAATDGVGKAMVVDLVPSEVKGTAIGMLGTVTGVATLVSSVAAGFLWDRVGSAAPFLYGFAGAVGAIVVLSLVRRPKSA